MKKVFSAIVAMMLAVPSFAQFASGGFELDKENLYYGARMGLTLANLSGDFDHTGIKTGLTLGGVVGLRVSTSNPVFLESGLYYTQRGCKDGDVSMTLKNLEVPILIKYGIKASDEVAVLPFMIYGYMIMKDGSINGWHEGMGFVVLHQQDGRRHI